MEEKVVIKLNAVDKVLAFANTVKNFRTDINLCSKNNPRYIVDAKSIMGIYALDLSNELYAILTNGNDEEEKTEFVNIMKQFA